MHVNYLSHIFWEFYKVVWLMYTVNQTFNCCVKGKKTIKIQVLQICNLDYLIYTKKLAHLNIFLILKRHCKHFSLYTNSICISSYVCLLTNFLTDMIYFIIFHLIEMTKNSRLLNFLNYFIKKASYIFKKKGVMENTNLMNGALIYVLHPFFCSLNIHTLRKLASRNSVLV